MLELRLGGDLGFAVVWILAVATTLAGLLAWRKSGWRMGWAPVVALVGFQQIWWSGLLSLGVLRYSGSGELPFAWRAVVAELPLLVALVCGAVLAWSTPRSGRGAGGRPIPAGALGQGDATP